MIYSYMLVKIKVEANNVQYILYSLSGLVGTFQANSPIDVYPFVLHTNKHISSIMEQVRGGSTQ